MKLEWIIGLSLIGMLMVLTEIVVPGMVVGIAGALLILVASVAAFLPPHDAATGFCVLAGQAVGGVLLFWGWSKYFPKTGIGQRMILQKDGSDWHGYDKKQTELLGKAGVAQSMLRPAGIATIDGHRVDVVTRGEMIDPGTAIEVVEVEGNRIVVGAHKTAQS